MSGNSHWMHSAPQDFVEFLKQEQIHKFYMVYDADRGRVVPSHPQLQPVADFMESDRRDFAQHEGLFFQVSKHHDTLLGAFLHRTNRGQGCGGLRCRRYDTMEEYLRDGLRLSRGMTHKNALAGLWLGGGKGAMASNPAVDIDDPAIRTSLFQDYGEFVASLDGCYITAEDVGTTVDDMANVYARNRFVTCIPPQLGGTGNPSIATARGVICGMEAALDFCGSGGLQGKTVAVQGVGNVGAALIGYLFEKGVKQVFACDINPALLERVQETFAGKPLEVRLSSPGDLSFFEIDCDVLAPCAFGAVLNPRTIPAIKARIVCGAANNQLEDPQRDDQALHDRGILYVPDFLVNRMGIVHCGNEPYGHVTHDPAIERHLLKDWDQSIYRTTLRVLETSCAANEPPAKAAVGVAEELSLESHPIFGHRGQQIIASLIEKGWHRQ